MTHKPTSTDLDKAPKIKLQNLLELAKASVKGELVACGCSEDELVGLRLECQVLQLGSNKPVENYFFEWSQIPQNQTREIIEEVSGNQLARNTVEPSISDDFIINFFAILREAFPNFNEQNPLEPFERGALQLSTKMNFLSGKSVDTFEECDKNCARINGYFQKSLYRMKGDKKEKIQHCIGICSEPSGESPTD